jgi:tetratricopeptide (TPR) repeat protein
MKLHSAISRREVADALRQLHRTPQRIGDDLLDWLMTLLPTSRPVIRCKVDQLLDRGDCDVADTLLARAMRHHARHPAFEARRARSLLIRGKVRQAESHIRRALRHRPHHVQTLLLAAECARQLGDLPGAIHRLETARTVRPTDVTVLQRLIAALIEAECLQRAEHYIRQLDPVPPLLLAQLRRAERRDRDAIDILAQALASTAHPDRQDEYLRELVHVLDETGQVRELVEVIQTIGPQHPQAMLRAAEALLVSGRFSEAEALAGILLDQPPYRSRALYVSIVATASLGLETRTRFLLDELAGTKAGIDHAHMAHTWLRAARGRVMRRQQQTRLAGVDPYNHPLTTFLQHAVCTLADATAESGTSADECASMLNHCRDALEQHLRPWIRKPDIQSTTLGVGHDAGPYEFGHAAEPRKAA